MAVLINKAMIEIPPKFAGRAPVHLARLDSGRASATLVSLIDRDWKWSAGAGRGRQILRQMDEGRGEEAHRATCTRRVSVTPEACMRERPYLKPYEGRELTVIAWLVGENRAKPQSGVRRCGGSTGIDLHALDQEGEGGVRRAGDRGAGVSVSTCGWGRPP